MAMIKAMLKQYTSLYVYDRAGATHALIISIALNNMGGQNKKTEAITSVLGVTKGLAGEKRTDASRSLDKKSSVRGY